MFGSVLALLLSISQLSLGSAVQDAQAVIAPPNLEVPTTGHAVEHIVNKAIFAALDAHSDPVAALLSLQPDIAAELAEPRLLQVFGEQQPEWLTEGDKLRLRRHGKKFMDITDHKDAYSQQAEASLAGKASKPTSSARSTKVLCLRYRKIYPA